MKRLIERIGQRRRNGQRKRRVFGGGEWMRGQLARMASLDQGLVRMSVGR